MNKEFDLFLNSIYTLYRDKDREDSPVYCYMLNRKDCAYNLGLNSYCICECVIGSRCKLDKVVR